MLAILRALDLGILGQASQMTLTFAIVVPLGPVLHRIVFQPLMGAKVLVLLIAAVATHLVLVGLALLAFGPEGWRTQPFSDVQWQVGPMTLPARSLLVLGVSVALMAALGWAFSATVAGKALRAIAVNLVGARVVGIRPEHGGRLCFLLAAATGAASGVLIAPITTIYYDSDFPIALKGFVAAIAGGLVSYPAAMAGAIVICRSSSCGRAMGGAWRTLTNEMVVSDRRRCQRGNGWLGCQTLL